MRWVQKHPAPDTLAKVVFAETAPEGNGWEPMDDAAFAAWQAAELAAGWTPVRSAAPNVVVHTPLDLLSRMTPEEEAALNASTDLAVMIVRNRLATAQEVRSDDPRTAEGKAVLIAKGILTAERAEEIFGGV